MTDKQLRQAIINPTQILVSDGTEVESNLGYFNLGATGRDLLATATQAEARTAIGSPAFAGDATATITTNSVVRSQIDSSGNVLSTIPGGSTLLPEFKCRAWVNFDGTTTPPTIRGSGNISSITRVIAGIYTINFLSPMPDANYGGCLGGDMAPTYNAFYFLQIYGQTTNSFNIGCARTTNVYENLNKIHVTIFR